MEGKFDLTFIRNIKTETYLNINRYVKLTFVILTSASIILKFFLKHELFDKLSIYMLVCYYFFCLLDTLVIGLEYKKTEKMLIAIDFPISKFLLSIVVLLGFIVGLTDYNDYYKYYWLITVGYYAIFGVVYSTTTNIPIKMTHGGWKEFRKGK